MKISVVGSGYVGLVTGACFSEMGNEVICVDSDASKIENLKKGKIPIYEPGLEEIIQRNYKNENLKFTNDIKEAVEKTGVCFIAVGTPMSEDGSADLQHVLNVAESIGKFMIHDMVVVDKSTVPVGTADKVKNKIESELLKRGKDYKVYVVSNPEFLKEGAAIEDFMKPDRIVIGSSEPFAIEKMRELYSPFTSNHERFILMDIRSAEMTKYAANAMLAVKISFMNEMANICERVGADINKIRLGIGSDHRIGYHFIYPGIGYGGSCFPKDVQALIKTSGDFGYESRILKAVEEVNYDQKKLLIDKIKKRFSGKLDGKKFAIWGMAFKPNTDDMREAPSIVIINDLTGAGADINAYDPQSINEARHYYLKDNSKVKYFDSKYACLKDCDAMLLLTEWKEFRSPDFEEIGKLLKNKIIFDGRNQYNADKLKESGFEYYQIGVGVSEL